MVNKFVLQKSEKQFPGFPCQKFQIQKLSLFSSQLSSSYYYSLNDKKIMQRK